MAASFAAKTVPVHPSSELSMPPRAAFSWPPKSEIGNDFPARLWSSMYLPMTNCDQPILRTTRLIIGKMVAISDQLPFAKRAAAGQFSSTFTNRSDLINSGMEYARDKREQSMPTEAEAKAEPTDARQLGMATVSAAVIKM